MDRISHFRVSGRVFQPQLTEGVNVGILDKLLGRDEAPQPRPAQWPGAGAAQSADEQAIARYRYMLKTAPPETIEQAHAEAFAKLTPEQRNMLLQELSSNIPDAERPLWSRGR